MAAKILAVILLALSCLALAGAVTGVVWLDSENAYQAESVRVMTDHAIDSRLETAVYPLLNEAQYTPVNELHRGEPTRFELLDENGAVLAGNLGEDETALRSRTVQTGDFYGGMFFTAADKPLTPREGPSWDYSPTYGAAEPRPTPRPQAAEETAEPEGTKVCFVRMSWLGNSGDLGYDMQILAQLFAYRYALIGAAAGAFLLAVLLFVFLMAAAGHRDASGEVKAGFVEKIPADLLWLLGISAATPLAVLISETFNGRRFVSSLLIAVVSLVGIGLLALLCLMSTAVRLKLGTFLDSCLICRFVRWLWRGIRAVFAGIGKLLRGLPLVWKWVPVFLVLMIADLCLVSAFRGDTDMLIFGSLLRWALLGAGLLYLVLAFRRLRNGAKAIAQGEENVVVDDKYLIGDLKDHAEDLNHIRDGLSRAVDERMKSERLRTELITNVSHDIKTPLTSIVNYVDLLSREELQNEKAGEYIEVLQRQSARLKKLTDDLVEASKASTGNLPVSLESLELGVLLDQLSGEYSERLAEKQLTLLVTKPAEAVSVQADPRHLWRVLDNLMSNVLKYAMPGTRVYLDLERENGRAALRLRNISAAPLHVKPEELTERFVRGDSARSTEGSGLGLAIAASLCKLQNIELLLATDGDLFKVTLLFA